MALDFPNSPTDGQVYGNYTYSSSRGAWLNTATPSRMISTSDLPPSTASNGDMWMDTTGGGIYTYYNDGTSSQWVQMKGNASLSSTIGPNVDSLSLRSPNYIINGAFDFWQRGTASIAASLATYTADRWLANLSDVNGARDVSQQSFTAGELSGAYNTYYLRHTVTAGGAATTYCRMEQRVEDVRTLSGQTVTVSFYAKAQTAGMKVAVGFNQNFGSGGSPSSEVPTYAGQVTLTTSWARYSVTVTLPSISGKTIGTTATTSYLSLLLWQSAGANFASQTGSLGTQTGYIDYWGVQLEAGAVAGTFRRNAPSLQAELAACQRYYYSLINQTAAGNPWAILPIAWTPNGTTAEIWFTTNLRQVQGTPPSLVLSSASHFVEQRTGSVPTGIAVSSNSLQYGSPTVGVTFTMSSGMVVGGTAVFRASTAGAILALSAEL